MTVFTSSRPADCFDWLSPEIFQKHAHDSYQAAVRDCYPPQGESFVQDGWPWADRSDFAQRLIDEFQHRISLHACQAGISGFELACEKAPIKQLCSEQSYAFSSEAGQSPAAMAHGCAALALGAGSAAGDLERSGNAKEVIP